MSWGEGRESWVNERRGCWGWGAASSAPQNCLPYCRQPQDLRHGRSHPTEPCLSVLRVSPESSIPSLLKPNDAKPIPASQRSGSPHLDGTTAPAGQWEKASAPVHRQLPFIYRESSVQRKDGAGDGALPAAAAGSGRDAGDAPEGGDVLDRAVKGPWQVWPFPAQLRGPGEAHICVRGSRAAPGACGGGRWRKEPWGCKSLRSLGDGGRFQKTAFFSDFLALSLFFLFSFFKL